MKYDLYEKDVVSIASNANLSEAARLMRENHIGDVVVVEDRNGGSRPIGILTDRDLVIETLGQEVLPDAVRVNDIMSKSMICAKSTDGIYDMIRLMKDNGIGRLPVVDEKGSLVGIVTAKKILDLLVQELGELVSYSERQHARENDSRH